MIIWSYFKQLKILSKHDVKVTCYTPFIIASSYKLVKVVVLSNM